jgi:hypothetical protein
MRVTEKQFETAVKNIKAAANYGGVDAEAMRDSGGDVEHHYAVRGGTKVAVALGDHHAGVFEIADEVAAKVLGDHYL